jgi:low affinity Fe/Cu permease
LGTGKVGSTAQGVRVSPRGEAGGGFENGLVYTLHTWQLVINTATTIITFLMVFVIQNTQNRDTASMHIKIDELIRVTQKARNVLLDLEELDDHELKMLRQDYERLARKEIPLHQAKRSRAKAVPEKPASRNR